MGLRWIVFFLFLWCHHRGRSSRMIFVDDRLLERSTKVVGVLKVRATYSDRQARTYVQSTYQAQNTLPSSKTQNGTGLRILGRLGIHSFIFYPSGRIVGKPSDFHRACVNRNQLMLPVACSTSYVQALFTGPTFLPCSSRLATNKGCEGHFLRQGLFSTEQSLPTLRRIRTYGR